MLIFTKKNLQTFGPQNAHVAQNIYLKEGTIAENIAYGESPNKLIMTYW